MCEKLFRGNKVFWKKRKDELIHNEPEAEGKTILKYPKPDILLIDIEDKSQENLSAAGYKVSSGSFGKPYKVPKSDYLQPVIVNHALPEYSEKDIVIVDLIPDSPLEKSVGEKHVSDGSNDWWASCSHGIIDPRPRSMVGVSKDFDRILSYGGVFIIFADERYKQNLSWGSSGYSKSVMPYDNWSFLSILDEEHIKISSEDGQEIVACESNYFADIIGKYAADSRFYCTLSPTYRIDTDKWAVLANNKYGDTVSAAIFIDNGRERKSGLILIFPQIKNKSDFLLDLLKEPLPLIAPHLFPYIEEAKWIRREEYELPEIINLKGQIEETQKQAEMQVGSIKTKINEVREENRYLYDLLRETDRKLVEAVIHALKIVGFTNIVDVDEEIKKEKKDGSLREDIQIKDQSPILIVDVKGITGKPSDPESMQSQKHASMRMKEWNRTDVNSLTIINHQRHLPPLDRENHMPYRQEILDAASQVNLGLMTTWDLYRLIRSFFKNNWKPEYVKPLFYNICRIEVIPVHYKYLGYVNQIWPKAGAFSICIESEKLKKGDRIGFELPVEFEEQIVESMQLKDGDVAEANVGDEIGIKNQVAMPHLRKGTRVFRVETNL